jgi:hypothetical protein
MAISVHVRMTTPKQCPTKWTESGFNGIFAGNVDGLAQVKAYQIRSEPGDCSGQDLSDSTIYDHLGADSGQPEAFTSSMIPDSTIYDWMENQIDLYFILAVLKHETQSQTA